jgi:hypothetical protein
MAAPAAASPIIIGQRNGFANIAGAIDASSHRICAIGGFG